MTTLFLVTVIVEDDSTEPDIEFFETTEEMFNIVAQEATNTLPGDVYQELFQEPNTKLWHTVSDVVRRAKNYDNMREIKVYVPADEGDA